MASFKLYTTLIQRKLGSNCSSCPKTQFWAQPLKIWTLSKVPPTLWPKEQVKIPMHGFIMACIDRAIAMRFEVVRSVWNRGGEGMSSRKIFGFQAFWDCFCCNSYGRRWIAHCNWATMQWMVHLMLAEPERRGFAMSVPEVQWALSELGFPNVCLGNAKCLVWWGLSGRLGRDTFKRVTAIFASILKLDNWTHSCQPVCWWCHQW